MNELTTELAKLDDLILRVEKAIEKSDHPQKSKLLKLHGEYQKLHETFKEGVLHGFHVSSKKSA